MAERLWNKPKRGSVRSLRVAHEIREIISDVLYRDKPYDEKLGDFSVTVTSVKVSSSLQDAVIYVIPLEREKSDKIMQYLNRLVPRFRSDIAHRLGLKCAPNIKFEEDESFDYADHMNEVFKRISENSSSKE